jgi:beta-lactam-binding protein with PASTA domain
MSAPNDNPAESTSTEGETPRVSPPQEPTKRNRVWMWVAIAVAVIVAIAILLNGRGEQTATKTGTATAPSTNVATPTTPAVPIPAGTTAVPNVVGLSSAAAEAALTDAGFVPLTTIVVTSDKAAGNVVAQAPAGGGGLVPGSQVGIGVARAQPLDASTSVPAPNVYQMSKSKAQSVLMNAGLMPVFLAAQSEDTKGLVLTQAPISSEPVQMNGVVLVALSTGVAPKTASIAIPDAIGMPEADAVKALKAAGLSSQIVLGPNAATPKGAVFRQIPQAGGLTGPDTPVALAVSLGPVPSGGATITVPDVKGMDAVTAIKALADAGLLAQQADIDDTQTPPGKVAAQVPSVGWTVPSGSVVIISVATAAS